MFGRGKKKREGAPAPVPVPELRATLGPDPDAVQRLKRAGEEVCAAGERLRAAFEAFENESIRGAVPWSASGQPIELLHRVQAFVGTPTTAQRMYRESVRRATRTGERPTHIRRLLSIFAGDEPRGSDPRHIEHIAGPGGNPVGAVAGFFGGRGPAVARR